MTDERIVNLWREHREVMSFARAFETEVREECAKIADEAEPWCSADLIRGIPTGTGPKMGRWSIWEFLAASTFFIAILLACFL